jgi:pseudouridine kinase
VSAAAPSERRVAPGKCAVVVGGANTDVVGIPEGALLPRDSNPGHVRVSAGGVARNIAENLGRLGVATQLVTAFGRDDAGAELAAACRVAGVGVGASVVSDDLPSARYLAIVDAAHDLAVAVNDMRVIDLLTPEALGDPARVELFARADIVVADANLPAESLRWLADNVTAPLVVDPVSVAKAPRVAAVLGVLAALTPSAAEAGVLLGRGVSGIDDARRAAEDLVSRGVGAAFVTCGPAGVAWADGDGSGILKAPSVEIASTNGAGDAFCAGIAYALLAGARTAAAAVMGSAMSAVALQAEETVSPTISPETVFGELEE